MNAKAETKTKKKRRRMRDVIPGKGLTLGISITMLSLLILIPLASVMVYSFRMSWSDFWSLILQPNVTKAFTTSILCALIAALINCVFGLILAWILVRYEFPFKRFIDTMIELPFALPTAVAGITLSRMYSTQGMIGQIFEPFGIRISYTRAGLIIALVFIGIPFVVRALQPIIEKLPQSFEEASAMLGAGRFYTFRRVILPELLPALLTGFGLALSRGIGEYGSVIYISGNSEKNGTQVVSYIIMQKLNSGNADYAGAAAIALILLIISFILLFVVNMLQLAAGRRTR